MTLKRTLFALSMTVLLATASVAATDSKPPTDKDFIAYDQPVIAFTHATLVDGTGAKAMRDQTLVIDKGRITALGKSSKVKVPQDAKIIDAQGKTLMPGFVMVHEHMFYPAGGVEYNEMSYSFPRLYLAGGTTTMRTAGSMMPYADINVRDAINAGKVIGPDMDVTGPYLNGPGLPIPAVHVLSGPDDAERTVNYWADEGVTSYKAYMQITRDELKRVIDTAHARKAKVTAHLCSVTYREAVDMGIDNLEHGFFVSSDFVKDKQPDQCPKSPAVSDSLAAVDAKSTDVKSLMRDMIDHHVALTSTLTVFETFVPNRPKAPQGALDLMLPEVRAQYEASWNKVQNSKGRMTPETYLKLARMEKQYADAGGLLLAGTDPTGYGGVVPGYSAKREIELLVEAGFGFEQAVKVATFNGAKYLGRDADVGTLAVGKRADLVVIDGDPAKTTTDIEHMSYVFKNGVGYDTQKIFDATHDTVGLH
ncbi:enamidase [Dyella jiangningensis]|uniref:amidohydrolase family protein n=1 Tax=Dyella sp. AtDHG13 TaxID=1938897 RepID=UPI000891A9FC|nr:amidohydrolase family protein [Dyella sp. AtDHG13]PXV60387.1 enamidase [Dyella sp. AtDHG13]SDJ43402.1 enamidase [Dyella jiangningensis]